MTPAMKLLVLRLLAGNLAELRRRAGELRSSVLWLQQLIERKRPWS